MKRTGNLVLLTIECFRAIHVHMLGYPREITRNLDTLGSRVKHHIQFEAEIESMAEKKRLRIASRG